jgi:2-dehydro-3-deoxy-D-arabinonate dehydratase
MQLCKIRRTDGTIRIGRLLQNHVELLDSTLSAILHADDPASFAADLKSPERVPISEVKFLAPIENQEVWAAGVTYKRSKVAREEESASTGGSRFYDLVYNADRPELFFKSPPSRVVTPGDAVRIRRDAKWSVPEPELALVISPALKIVGYTIGNDMSSRDIEGENPLYLPQAKMYDGACTLGPVITLASAMPARSETKIAIKIGRGSAVVFEGTTTLDAMKRTPEELVTWLGREMSFPEGAILFTGTGIVPPDHFTLASGDEVQIEISGIGRLSNPVA